MLLSPHVAGSRILICRFIWIGRLTRLSMHTSNFSYIGPRACVLSHFFSYNLDSLLNTLSSRSFVCLLFSNHFIKQEVDASVFTHLQGQQKLIMDYNEYHKFIIKIIMNCLQNPQVC